MSTVVVDCPNCGKADCGHSVVQYPALMDGHWLRRMYRTLSANQIARRLGCHRSVVGYWLTHHDIPKRSMATARADAHLGAHVPMAASAASLAAAFSYADDPTPECSRREEEAIMATAARNWRTSGPNGPVVIRQVETDDGDGLAVDQMFDYKAPPPPPPVRTVRFSFSDDEISAAAQLLREQGYVGRPCDDEQHSKAYSTAMQRRLVNSACWVPQFGEERPRWLSSRNLQIDGTWWAYIEVNDYAWIGRRKGSSSLYYQVDAGGVRTTQPKLK